MPLRGKVKAGSGGKVRTLNQAAVVTDGLNNKGTGQPSSSVADLEKLDIDVDVEGPEGTLEVETLNQTWLAVGGMPSTPDKGSEANDEVRYKMEAEPRGLCYIFNIKEFEGQAHKSRLGTDEDRDGLKRVFKKLKFEVETFEKDFDSVKMKDKIEELSKLSHEAYNCVVVIFLTHGKDGAVFGSDSMPLSTDRIISFFKADVCPSLEGKPKLFFFQSCRGKLFQKASEVKSDGDGKVGVEKYVDGVSDLFVGYSTVSGTKSCRNEEYGSWFIQELVKVFEKFADKEDLLTLMTKVKAGVSEHKAENEDEKYIGQSAECLDRLTKKLYF